MAATPGRWRSEAAFRILDCRPEKTFSKLNECRSSNRYPGSRQGVFSSTTRTVRQCFFTQNGLPALTGKDYKGLEIEEGGMASREFLRVTFTDVAESERARVRRALDLCCGQDTEGMVWILAALTSSVKRG